MFWVNCPFNVAPSCTFFVSRDVLYALLWLAIVNAIEGNIGNTLVIKGLFSHTHPYECSSNEGFLIVITPETVWLVSALIRSPSGQITGLKSESQ